MHPLVIHCLLIANLIQQEISSIIIEAKIDLREHATKIINYERKKEMILLTNEENKIHRKQKVCYICKK